MRWKDYTIGKNLSCNVAAFLYVVGKIAAISQQFSYTYCYYKWVRSIDSGYRRPAAPEFYGRVVLKRER